MMPNLAVTGPVTGATVAIASAGTLTQASGTIQAFASGTPDAPSLRFDGAQGVSLGAGTSLIASDVAGVLRIGASGGDISIQGALSSPTIVVSAPGHIITIGSFGGRDTIETGTTASARPVTGIIDGTEIPERAGQSRDLPRRRFDQAARHDGHQRRTQHPRADRRYGTLFTRCENRCRIRQRNVQRPASADDRRLYRDRRGHVFWNH